VRVLVVSEDAKERARASSALLLDAATEVVEVTDADEVRRRILVDGELFDVLVVDGDLAPRGGFATLYDLRSRAELEGTPAVPSLVLASREQDRWLASWSGANEVLMKPVDPFELRRRVSALDGAEPAPYGDKGSAAAQVASATRDHRR
jgi:DNA-binding response OmpR family regulator